MTRAHWPFCIITLQQRRLTIDENAVSNTISIGRATPTPWNSTNAGVGEKCDKIEREGIATKKKHQASKVQAAECAWFDTDDRHTHPAPEGNKQNKFQALERNGLKDEVTIKMNTEQLQVELIDTRCQVFGRPVSRSNNFRSDEVDTKEHDVEWIAVHKKET